MERIRPARTLYAKDEPIKIGVSSCLLGTRVRFDGGHKRNDFLVNSLGRMVEFVPVCPEVDIGLGVPRETLHLVRGRHTDTGLRLVATKSGIDYTDTMNEYAERRATALGGDDLSGYVLKKNSPSCGMERVRVYDRSGKSQRDGTGLFAGALIRRYPNLPIEEEGRLDVPHLRDNFVERVFAYRRLRTFFASPWTPAGLLHFHTAHRLFLMAHSPAAHRELNHFVASPKSLARGPVREVYEREFMAALKKPATRARHVRVLRYMMRYLRPFLDQAARDELLARIDQYRCGLMPLAEPIALFRRCALDFNVSELQGQYYVEPHPYENSIDTMLAARRKVE
jgi:uncharacterized protein YbbK (DUF523 family)/uncharacterized protein YbgA (DUF1722 family)